jgi:uncharacterized delta-60 repeat protein
MKKALLVLAVLSYSIYSHSQINVQWETRFDNNSSNDSPVDLELDGSGNVIVTGSSFNGVDYDIEVIKYDNDGSQLWRRTIAGAAIGVESPSAITVDNNDDVIVTGYLYQGGSDWDISTVKLNGSDGTILWQETFAGSNDFDLSQDVTVDASNNVYVSGGRYYSSVDVDFIIIKYDPAGNELWTTTFDGPNSLRDVAKVVEVAPNGDLYIAGESEDVNDGLDFYTMKLNPANGNTIWERRYDLNGSDDSPIAMAFDQNNDVIVTGAGYADINPEDNILTLKYNSAGTFQWSQDYNGSDDNIDFANAIEIDNFNNIYITGQAKNAGKGEDFVVLRYRPDGTEHWSYTYGGEGAGFDIGKSLFINDDYELYATGYSYNAASNQDYVTVRLDTAGNEVWQTRFNGPNNNADQALEMAIDAGGNIYVTGSSKGSGTLNDFSTIKYCQLTTVASNDTSVCIGESVTLTSSSAEGSNFTWAVISGDPAMSCTSCQNSVVTPNQTTTYTVSSESGSGCIDFDTVTVTINPLPGPTIINYTPLEFCLGDSVSLHTSGASAYLWNVPTNNTDSFIVVHNSGNYSVTVEDSMGCLNSTDVDVTTNDLPIIDGGADHAICLGDSTQLDATGGVSYLWIFDPSIDNHADAMTWVYPTATTTYEVVGTDGNGCKDTGDVVISINPLPAPFSLSLIDDTMVTSPYSFGNEWFFNDAAQPGINSNQVDFCDDAFGAGEYWVTYTDANSCQINSDTLTMDISDTIDCWRDTTTDIGVNEFYFEDLEVYLYPNPSVNSFQLTFIGNTIPQSFEIYGMDGKAVLSESKVLVSQIVDITHLNKGQYFVIFQFENGKIARKKLIKN